MDQSDKIRLDRHRFIYRRPLLCLSNRLLSLCNVALSDQLVENGVRK